MKTLGSILFVLITLFVEAQEFPTNNYQNEFENAYQQYPTIPRGVLEAVSYTMTRFQHLQNVEESCTGIPKTYGVMGLTLNGKDYFNNNLLYISQVSGISVNDILNNPQQNILAFAAAYHQLALVSSFKSQEKNVAHILTQLSELPSSSLQADYALNAHLYSILSFMNDAKMQKAYNFTHPNYDLEKVFGIENLKVLSAKKIVINSNNIEGEDKTVYKVDNLSKKSVDYPVALSDFTTCNYSSRNGTSISAVTIHTIQGSYAGCISWFKNCSANVSAHYVLRSSDGQVTQMVLESDKAWHVGNSNPYSIGLEHEGFINDSTWYTAAMYQSSADLVRDITQSGYGINPLRTAYFPWAPTTHHNVAGIPGSCVTTKGHQHFPDQTHTDPGENWDWDYFYKLINEPTTPITTNTNAVGNVADLGDSSNYTNDERTLFLIKPTNAESITLTVNQFDIEPNWDYLYIYEGTTPFDTKIGEYTGTTIPPTFHVNSGSILIEFRSDCATTAPGYNISWSAVIADTIKPTTIVSEPPNPTTNNFTANFTDEDNIGGRGVKHQFYQVADFDGENWFGNNEKGFFNDEFLNGLNTQWTSISGNWNNNMFGFSQLDETNSNTNTYANCNQNIANKFLYNYQFQIMSSGANKRTGFHYMCDDATLTNRGNSYFVWFRQDDEKLQFYKVVNDTFSLKKEVLFTFNVSQEYDVKIVFDKTNGQSDIYVDDDYISSWTDSLPITSGSFISLRTGNAAVAYNNIEVYKNRTSSELITVGAASTNDIRYSGFPGGRVNSIVIDSAYNISSKQSKFVNVDLSTSISELNNNDFTIYPNPAKEKITLTFNTKKQRLVRVLNITGQVLIKQKVASKRVSINLANISSGTYYVEVEAIGEIRRAKLIKQ